jgi:hypothetical protein
LRCALQYGRKKYFASIRPLQYGGDEVSSKVTTLESTQKTSNGDQNIKKLCGPLMADLKETQVQSTIVKKVLYDLNEQ